MKRNNKLFGRIKYDRRTDTYILYTSTDGGKTWDYNIGCKCQNSIKDNPEDEPCFIHISLIQELKNAIRNGYEIIN